MSKRDRAYLSVARYLASKSNQRMKHGAIVVKGGRVLGTGYNKGRNHPFIVSSEHIKEHCSRHAEVEAIRDAGSNTKGAVIYVARVSRHGHDRNSKPCERCQDAIDAAGIKKVIYTSEK
jgi:deoxycytidylate deaminase